MQSTSSIVSVETTDDSNPGQPFSKVLRQPVKFQEVPLPP